VQSKNLEQDALKPSKTPVSWYQRLKGFLPRTVGEQSSQPTSSPKPSETLDTQKSHPQLRSQKMAKPVKKKTVKTVKTAKTAKTVKKVKKSPSPVKKEVLEDLMDMEGYEEHKKHLEAQRRFNNVTPKQEKFNEMHQKHLENQRPYSTPPEELPKEPPETTPTAQPEFKIVPPTTSPPHPISPPSPEPLEESAPRRINPVIDPLIQQLRTSRIPTTGDTIARDVRGYCCEANIAAVFKMLCDGAREVFPDYNNWTCNPEIKPIKVIHEILQRPWVVEGLLPTVRMVLGDNFGNPEWRGMVTIGLGIFHSMLEITRAMEYRKQREGKVANR